jgi:hypothetical protein
MKGVRILSERQAKKYRKYLRERAMQKYRDFFDVVKGMSFFSRLEVAWRVIIKRG